jgi:predicted transcriptional regulator
MASLSLRIDDDLHARLSRRARNAGITVTELLLPALEQAADPRRGYVYTTQDEILSGVIQTMAIVAASVRKRSPELLEQGMADARQMLAERGLLAPEERP